MKSSIDNVALGENHRIRKEKRLTVVIAVLALRQMQRGRVEDWRGIPKVKPICCSPFPLGVPQ